MVSIQDCVRLGSCLFGIVYFGIVYIWDCVLFRSVSIPVGVHSGMCPFWTVSSQDDVHSALYPFGIVDRVHSESCPFGMMFIWNRVQLGSSSFGNVFFGFVYRIT